MIDQEEAELRKEQLRLQNLALAQQVADRARSEHRAQAAKQLAVEAGQAGLKILKIAGLVAGALVALLVVVVTASVWKENAAAEARRHEELEWAKHECMKPSKAVVIRFDGKLYALDQRDVGAIPSGAIEKKCSEVTAGELP